MPEKFDRCVSKVKAGGGVDNPYAVCNASIGEGGVGSGRKSKGMAGGEDIVSKMIGQGIPPDKAKRFVGGMETSEGGMGSGRKPYKQKAHDQPSFLPPVKTPRAKPSMPQRIKKGPLEARPLIKEIDEMIVRLRENHTVQSMPNTSGLEGDWQKTNSWTPTDFSVIDPEQKLKEDMSACEICGLPNEYHAEITDHPYIPNMKNEMGMNGAKPPMQPVQPPQMPQQIPPPQPPQQEHGQQYTVSIPASLGNVKIGGKKVNEMIREIDQFIQT